MTDFVTHTIESAPEKARPFLEGAAKAYGFLPNLLGTMAEAPTLVEGYLTLAGIFDRSSLSVTERQIVLMTNNRLNDCSYCMAAHSTISQMSKVPADVIEALRTNTPIADAKLEALRKFAEVVNLSRGWPQDDEVEALLAAGYTKATVLEVVLGTAVKVMSNYTNHIATTPLDAAFAPNAWSADLAKAA